MTGSLQGGSTQDQDAIKRFFILLLGVHYFSITTRRPRPVTAGLCINIIFFFWQRFALVADGWTRTWTHFTSCRMAEEKETKMAETFLGHGGDAGERKTCIID